MFWKILPGLIVLAIVIGLILLDTATTTQHGPQVCQGQPIDGCAP